MAKKIYNVTYTTGYTYNLAGGVVNATYPSGRVVKHEYDNIGRLKNVKNNATGASYLSNAAYSTANQLTGFTYGNGVVASYGYSADRLQLTSLSYAKSGTTHLSLSYSYSQSGNNNGQIASITDNVQSGRTVAYTYDSLHRLKTAVTNGSAGYPQWGLSWSYDRYGNRTGQSVTHGSGPSSSPTISTSTNRITALGGSNYYYDSNGSLTQDDLFKYKYDAENRVVEIRNLSDTLLTSYAYDGHSMQVIKVAGGTRTWFLYAGSQLVSEYYDAAANTYTSPTSPGSAPADTASTLLYQHSDHLSTRVTTDNAGTVANQQAHYPYGENWYATGTADPSVTRKFTSYRKEGGALASGQINYAIARYHGARIGRFHRPDPVRGNFRNPQRLNRYAYVTNNPVRYTDPRGLDMVDPANAEGFWGGMGGDRNPDPVINYSAGEGFALGSLHYRTGDGDGGGTGYWYNDLQNSYLDWLNATPVGCWLGDGFRDEACVAAGGDSGGSGNSNGDWLTSNLGGKTISDCSRENSDCIIGAKHFNQACKQASIGVLIATPGYCLTRCIWSGLAYWECVGLCSGVGGLTGFGMAIGCEAKLLWDLDRCDSKFKSCVEDVNKVGRT